MAARPVWRGHLRLALVSCPIALVPARHERSNLHFNFINPETGNRVRMVTEDAETHEQLNRGDLVRGFEFEKDHYVLLSDEDFETARIESSTVLTVSKFVERGSIDPILFDSAYLVAPDGEAGLDVYTVLRDAMAGRNVVALSRVVLFRRERAVAIAVEGDGLQLHTLHEVSDLADPKDVFSAVPNSRPDPAMVKLAEQLIERQAGPFDISDFEDRYEARLREVIAAKVKGTGLEPIEPDEPDRGNVIDLMAALKQSLGKSGSEKKAGAGKPVATKAAPKAAATAARRAPAAKPRPKRRA